MSAGVTRPKSLETCEMGESRLTPKPVTRMTTSSWLGILSIEPMARLFLPS